MLGDDAAISAARRQRARRWLVTGVAGFIGSHLLERCSSSARRWSASTTSRPGTAQPR